MIKIIISIFLGILMITVIVIVLGMLYLFWFKAVPDLFKIWFNKDKDKDKDNDFY